MREAHTKHVAALSATATVEDKVNSWCGRIELDDALSVLAHIVLSTSKLAVLCGERLSSVTRGLRVQRNLWEFADLGNEAAHERLLIFEARLQFFKVAAPFPPSPVPKGSLRQLL